MPRWNDDDKTPLAKLRDNAGFTREEAASILNVVMMTLYRYEKGKTDIPLGIAENMATLYNVPFDVLRTAAKDTKELNGINQLGRINNKREALRNGQ